MTPMEIELLKYGTIGIPLANLLLDPLKENSPLTPMEIELLKYGTIGIPIANLLFHPLKENSPMTPIILKQMKLLTFGMQLWMFINQTLKWIFQFNLKPILI